MQRHAQRRRLPGVHQKIKNQKHRLGGKTANHEGKFEPPNAGSPANPQSKISQLRAEHRREHVAARLDHNAVHPDFVDVKFHPGKMTRCLYQS